MQNLMRCQHVELLTEFAALRDGRRASGSSPSVPVALPDFDEPEPEGILCLTTEDTSPTSLLKQEADLLQKLAQRMVDGDGSGEVALLDLEGDSRPAPYPVARPPPFSFS